MNKTDTFIYMSIPEIAFPSTDTKFIENPYPYLKELRESSPMHLDSLTGLTLITNFDDVKNVQISKNFSSSEPQSMSNNADEKLLNKKDYEYFAKRLKEFEKKKKVTPGLGWAKMLCRQRMTEIEMVLEPLGFEV